MRGVAAVVVVFCHTYQLGLGPVHLPFAHLAVDLFFVLSGFVLAFAYDTSFSRGLGLWAFMVKRWIRLYPLFAIGIILGLASVPLTGKSAWSASHLMLYTALNALILPGSRFNGFFFSAPCWSLFFEFWIGSLAFGLFWRRLRGIVLAAVIISGGAALLFSEWTRGTIDGGWDVGTLWVGLARVSFSFFVGVAIARFRATPPPPAFEFSHGCCWG